MTYQIPTDFFYRLHHVRPRFKNNPEEVLLYFANAVTEIDSMSKKEFNYELNKILFKFSGNEFLAPKTIDNWRTEIATLFGFIQRNDDYFFASIAARRLSENQYLDEFFNYFLYTFQYPGGHVKPHTVLNHIQNGIRFKPCDFTLRVLTEGSKLLGKPFGITAEELTQCAYYDLRVTAHNTKTPFHVAQHIIHNRQNNIKYDHKYPDFRKPDGDFSSTGDVYRYAGDILDYMVLANLLDDKGTGYYYYLNTENQQAIDHHLEYPVWFNGYDRYYQDPAIKGSELRFLEKNWFDFVNSYDHIEAFAPHISMNEVINLSMVIEEYYTQLTGGQKVPTKIFGDYGETLVLAHEHLRVMNQSNRRHLINKIPTHLGVGYDVQSVEIPTIKRYIEVKTTKSMRPIANNRFKLTPNEWDSAMTLTDRYFIYYLTINQYGKNIFIIQDPAKQQRLGNIEVDKNLVVKFKKEAGQWQQLLEVKS